MSRSVHVSNITSMSKVLVALLLAAGCSGRNGAAGPAGQPGTNGNNGTPGTSCAVTDNHDGTSTIHCTDGTSATVSSGSAGTDGASCTLVNNGNGTRTITCGSDAGVVTVPDAVVDFTLLTAGEKAESAMSAVITGVTFPADGRPVVAIKVSERHGYGVKNLLTTAVTWRLSLLKLTAGVNSSANDTWVSYLATNDHSSASSETAAAANLTDNGDGTYGYRFAKVINGGPTAAGTTYEADKVHRLIVLLYATGNPFTPINLVKEFIPATGVDVTGQNDKVDGSSCLECHTTFRAIAGGTGELGGGEFHGGVRYDVKTCVACHNDQRRFTAAGALVTEPLMAADATWTGPAGVINGEAVMDLPVFIHKIHMGNKLSLTGGTYAGVPDPFETTYPQDVRNCVKCHRGPAAKADNWKNQPSRRACGSCHDNKTFADATPPGRSPHAVTNINPAGYPQADDSKCTTCHAAGALVGDVGSSHLTISPPNAHNIYADATATGNANTNAAYVAAAGAVPTGAKAVTYQVKSVSTWTDAANGNVLRPQIVFKFQLDGTDVVLPAPGSASELIPGFVGAPSAFFVFAVPEDGKVPADFNASASGYIRNIWNGTGTCSNAAATTTRTGGGTLTGPDATGFYTVQLTCAIIPANATMLTGGIGYTYGLGARQAPPNPDLDFVNNTQPLTQINLPAYPYVTNKKVDGATVGYGGRGGLIVPPHDISMVATGYTGRRAIVENARCASCHVALGVGPDFHAGQRNDAPTCSWCHNPNLTSSGWGANAKDFIHSIHGAEKRLTDFTWHEQSPTEGFWKTTYPGVLNRCEMCHLPGSYDFSASATIAAYPNMLPSTVAKGTYAAGSPHAPYVAEAQNYGVAFSYSALTGAPPVAADATTLVITPIVAACSSCHDSPIAVDHMQTNGGSFYEPRGIVAAKPQQEQCLLCHGPGRLASIAERHAIQP
jgi:OmcA/MtrC family decaheme c-type cytochrome